MLKQRMQHIYNPYTDMKCYICESIMVKEKTLPKGRAPCCITCKTLVDNVELDYNNLVQKNRVQLDEIIEKHQHLKAKAYDNLRNSQKVKFHNMISFQDCSKSEKQRKCEYDQHLMQSKCRLYHQKRNGYDLFHDEQVQIINNDNGDLDDIVIREIIEDKWIQMTESDKMPYNVKMAKNINGCRTTKAIRSEKNEPFVKGLCNTGRVAHLSKSTL